MFSFPSASMRQAAEDLFVEKVLQSNQKNVLPKPGFRIRGVVNGASSKTWNKSSIAVQTRITIKALNVAAQKNNTGQNIAGQF